MPELPEVETVRRGLAARMTGRRILAVEQRAPALRLPFPENLAARLAGRRVRGLRRRAKYILVDLDDGWTMLLHLGMSGRIVMTGAAVDGGAAAAPGRHDHLVLDLEGGLRVTFNDARRFGIVALARADALADHPLLAHLGPEPLEPGFDGALLAARLAGRRTTVKAALLDQRRIAGVGNIYASEALFRARLSPRRRASSIRGARAERLAAALRAVLAEAVEAGGSSLRDYVDASGELGYFQHRFAVYDREGAPCPRCGEGAPIRRIVQGARATFFCPRCQR